MVTAAVDPAVVAMAEAQEAVCTPYIFAFEVSQLVFKNNQLRRLLVSTDRIELRK